MSLVLSSTASLKAFYHQTFELRQNDKSIERHTLLVNPEDVQVNEPARASVTQTLGGAYVMDFGQGLLQVTLSGVTGYRSRYSHDNVLTDGYDEFVRLRDKIYRQFVKTNDPTMELYWYDWENQEYYQIQPTSFRLMRNKQAPLLYRYEIQFYCLRKVDVTSSPISTNYQDPDLGGIQSKLMSNVSTLGEITLSFED